MIEPLREVSKMSELDVRALEANFTTWRTERAEGLSDSKAFERYSVEQILKDSELSDEEVAAGDLGGQDDGGVDAMYLFMNTLLILDETDPPIPAGPVELHIIQAKYEKGFTETAVERLEAFARDLLDYNKSPDQLRYLNSKARDAIRRFRTKYDLVMGSSHTLSIRFHYACKAIGEPGTNDKVNLRVNNLKEYVRSQLTNADVRFVFWTSQKLLAAVRRVPQSRVVIPITKYFSADDGSTVCLVKLKDYAEKLLTDENGNLHTRFLEPNVRDYNGSGNPVNTQIRVTLNDPAPREEFWWLNNGITVVAGTCTAQGNRLTIDNPEIVNGLQTSHEIFSWYSQHRGTDDPRNVLLRILLVTDEKGKTKITKATNSQTKVSDLSLMATDRIQEEIEDRLRLYGLFYDRKRGEYRRLKKPIAKIVGMGELAQAVIAIALQRPDDSRARPQTYVKANSTTVFDERADRDLYAACILLDRQIEAHLSVSGLTTDERRDIRHYVSMLVACDLTRTSAPSQASIAKLTDTCNQPIDKKILNNNTGIALEAYRDLGGTDKVAKGTELRSRLLKAVRSRFPVSADGATAN
jgi:hypothetical protein